MGTAKAARVEEEVSKCCCYDYNSEPKFLVNSHVRLEEDVSEVEKCKGRENSHTTVGETAQAGMKWTEGRHSGCLRRH